MRASDQSVVVDIRERRGGSVVARRYPPNGSVKHTIDDVGVFAARL
jgi:hypothetical protein